MIKVAIISSTSGSVMNAALQLPYVRERICSVISDRECCAVDTALRYGITVHKFITRDAKVFSDRLAEFFSHNPHDLHISFYTKLFNDCLVDQLKGKLINFHPSILPACPGKDGFGDTIRSGSRFIGATVHLVDKGVDTGLPIIQSAMPYDPNLSLEENRHAVFVAQCKMLIQVVNWYEDDRIFLDKFGFPTVSGGQYHTGEFAPNLDFPPALNFIL